MLTGVPGAFCAGDDIGAFAEASKDPVKRDRYWNTIMRCYATLSDVPLPIITAIDGPCVGGGMTLALRADFRLVGPRVHEQSDGHSSSLHGLRQSSQSRTERHCNPPHWQ